tara:strand:+ start:1755 stop:2123 length:369 start_codon:yes stop_codon:yes gene_type:complete
MNWLRKRRVRNQVVEGISEIELLLRTTAVTDEQKAKYLYPQNESTTDQKAAVNMMVLAAMKGTAQDLNSDKAFRALLSRLSEEEMKHAQVIAIRRCQEWSAELEKEWFEEVTKDPDSCKPQE